MTASPQIPLNIALDDEATLSNWLPRPGSEALMEMIRDGALGDGIYVWGGEQTGKSHLAQAVCQAGGAGFLFLPLEELASLPAVSILDGVERADMVVYDNLQAVAGDSHWQTALFHAFNRRRDLGLPQMFTADRPPARFDTLLADLRSRLSSLSVFQLARWQESELGDLLRFRAGLRGLSLGEGVVSYLLARAPRSPVALLEILDALDRAALAQSRAITVPLISALRLPLLDP